jgi:hypothetical protein
MISAVKVFLSFFALRKVLFHVGPHRRPRWSVEKIRGRPPNDLLNYPLTH